jgi:hypothetical protein
MQGCKFFSHFYFILYLNYKAHTFTLNEYNIIIILEEAIKNVRFEKIFDFITLDHFKNKKLHVFLKKRQEQVDSS